MTLTALSTDVLRSRLDDSFPRLLQNLIDMVAIPSISSMPEHEEDMVRSAQLVKSFFETAGLEARIATATTPEGVVSRPAILAHTPHIDGAPRVLLYAHHDVQPTGDVSRWASDPFKAEVRGDRLYGRGTSDDGAGVIVHLGALTVLARDLAVNVTVFIEGEEEIGSPTFESFLKEYNDELSADVIIVADSDNWKAGEPALTTTLRGNTCATIEVTVADHAVHSGMFGGPLLDAVTCGAMLVSSFFDEAGDVAVEGLGGSDTADVVWDEDEYRDAAGVVDGVRLAGTGDLAARTWTKPAITVIGWDQTPIAKASNSLQSTTKIRISMRTVPGVEPAQAMAALERHIHAHAPFGARITITDVELGPGYQADTNAPATAIAHAALGEAWGVPAVNIGVGGSIPFISQLQEVFPQAQVLVTGVEDPKTNAHSEDESQYIPDLKAAILAHAIMLRDFAQGVNQAQES